MELAKEWRKDRALRHLEALLIVADTKSTFILSGNGDVIEPDDGLVAIGSGGTYALAAARALMKHSKLEREGSGAWKPCASPARFAFTPTPTLQSKNSKANYRRSDHDGLKRQKQHRAINGKQV